MIRRLFLITILLLAASCVSARDYSQLVFSAAPDYYDGRIDAWYRFLFSISLRVFGGDLGSSCRLLRRHSGTGCAGRLQS